MTALDYVVLGILGVSILLSVIRGMVREVLALLAWALGFIAASVFAADLATLLPPAVPDERLRLLAAFVGVFLAVLLLMSVLAMFVSKLVKSAGLGLEDRLLGGVFGLARGMLVVMVLVLAAGFTSLPREQVWRDAVRIKAWLPVRFAQRIRYD